MYVRLPFITLKQHLDFHILSIFKPPQFHHCHVSVKQDGYQDDINNMSGRRCFMKNPATHTPV